MQVPPRFIVSSVSRRRMDRAGLAVLGMLGLGLGVAYAVSGTRPVDADMIWRVASGGIHYGDVWGTDLASRYVYPPTLAQAVVALLPLGWTAFVVLWEALVFVALWAATREWALPVLAVSLTSMWFLGMGSGLANPLVLAMVGNVQSLVAAAIVIGLRRPGAWSFVALTKIFPGVGLLWFGTRERRRQLLRAVLVTVAIALASFIAAPAAWLDFLGFAARNVATPPPEPVIPVPFLLRLPATCLVVLWAARTERAWVVPIAAAFATPALYTWSWVSMSVAALPLLSGRAMTSNRAGDGARF